MTSNEKRRYERFENQELSVEVARPGVRGFIRTNPTAECMNFSRTGLQFDSPEPLKPGEKLVIDIAVDDINLEDLEAIVISQQQTMDGFCHGVRFCLESKKMDRDEIFHGLLLIEDRLKRAREFG